MAKSKMQCGLIKGYPLVIGHSLDRTHAGTHDFLFRTSHTDSTYSQSPHMSRTYMRIPFVHQDEESFASIKGSRYALAIELRPLGAV